jgi:hypothetical protein
MSGWTAQLPIVRESSWDDRRRIGMFLSQVQFTNCVLHNDALRPDACPFPKHPVLSSAIVNAGYTASFCLLVISRKEKQQLIKTIDFLFKNLEEILASRVLTFTTSTHLTAGLLSHFLPLESRVNDF